jgi:hypothetical protein
MKQGIYLQLAVFAKQYIIAERIVIYSQLVRDSTQAMGTLYITDIYQFFFVSSHIFI